MGEWSDSRWKCKLTWRRPLLVWEHEAVQDLSQHLEGRKPTMGKRDGWGWCHDERRYTLKQVYELLHSFGDLSKLICIV